jgi:LacI family transcriptional regulator/LacI family purine nucleotide synthesis repressor
MATMKQIADLAGVSRSTVSFVLNDSPLAKKIPERTHKKVHDAAEKLGYRPNEIAQALITGKTKVLGFVTTQMNRQFVTKMLWGAMEAVDQKGYYLKVFPVSNEESMESVLDNLLKRKVAAVILQGLGSNALEGFQQKLLENRIPCCLLGSSFSPATGLRVVSDDSQGAESAMSYLVEKGHRKVLYLNGQPDWPSFVIRRNGAMRGAEQNGIELTTATVESYQPPDIEDIETIRNEMASLIEKLHAGHTAILCANDLLGVLAVQACNRLGLKVPEDISVMGYSVSMLSQFCDPELTSVMQPHNGMGFEAASELIEVLNTEDERIFDRAVELKLPTTIEPGGTVASI